jgi:hypothetical protein
MPMRRPQLFICGIGGSLAAVMLTVIHWGCSPESVLEQRATDALTSNNLAHVYLVLREAVGNGAYFPKGFDELRSSVNSNLFVCPAGGAKPGPMREAGQWTDYIYIGNLTEGALMHVALVISPPENHEGNYGYVLFTDGVVSRFSADQVRQLIMDPFKMATTRESPSNTPQNIAYDKERVIVRVPQKLKQCYPDGTVFSAESRNQ